MFLVGNEKVCDTCNNQDMGAMGCYCIVCRPEIVDGHCKSREAGSDQRDKGATK